LAVVVVVVEEMMHLQVVRVVVQGKDQQMHQEHQDKDTLVAQQAKLAAAVAELGVQAATVKEKVVLLEPEVSVYNLQSQASPHIMQVVVVADDIKMMKALVLVA
jgi:hypothetical protein